jgi:CHASE2 domain-containing sensor protein
MYNRLIPSFLLVLALTGFWVVGQALEWPVYDLLTRWSAKPALNSPVTLVLIDDESIVRLNKSFGPMPWSRKTYLKIFQAIRAKNPALLVFDGHFVNLNQSRDILFFKALSGFPDLISGEIMPHALSTHSMPTDALTVHNRLHLGVVSLLEDSDGVIRRLKSCFQGEHHPVSPALFPAISVVSALDFLNRTHPGVSWILNLAQENGGSLLRLVPEGGNGPRLSMALDNEASFTLRWYRLRTSHIAQYAHSHPTIPLWRFFDASMPVSTLQGRIALLGSSSIFHRDFHRTPMARRHLGPDIHATAIDNILNRTAIWRLPPWLNCLVLGFLCWATFQVRLRLQNFGKTLFYLLGAMIIYFWLVVRKSGLDRCGDP